MAKKEGSGDRELRTILEEIGPEFIEAGARKITSQHLDEIMRDRDRIREEVRGGVLKRNETDVEQVISLLEDYVSGNYATVPYWSIAVMTFAMQYLVKPIDIIPDSLPRIGQLDDAMVLTQSLAMVKEQLRAYKIWKLADKLA